MQYTTQFTFALGPREKAALAALAQEDSSSEAPVLRHVISQAAEEHGVWICHQECNTDQDAGFKQSVQCRQPDNTGELRAQMGSDR